MKLLRITTFVGGLVILLVAFGFIYRHPFATSIWPWEDGRYSYLFVIIPKSCHAWVTTGIGALPVSLSLRHRPHHFHLLSTRITRTRRHDSLYLGIFSAIASLATFFWSLRIPLKETRPMPKPVKVSFWIFIASLFAAGGSLILGAPIFPWKLNPDSSVVFGCIFLGDAFYFLYGMFRPNWHNALGQLLSFLAYDLVLIVPFVGLLNTVEPDRLISLIIYTAVLIYSSGLAVYYLFINPQTRFGSQTR
jgi:hypothetical protein